MEGTTNTDGRSFKMIVGEASAKVNFLMFYEIDHSRESKQCCAWRTMAVSGF